MAWAWTVGTITLIVIGMAIYKVQRLLRTIEPRSFKERNEASHSPIG